MKYFQIANLKKRLAVCVQRIPMPNLVFVK
jgi:hypothetical protein